MSKILDDDQDITIDISGLISVDNQKLILKIQSDKPTNYQDIIDNLEHLKNILEKGYSLQKNQKLIKYKPSDYDFRGKTYKIEKAIQPSIDPIFKNMDFSGITDYMLMFKKLAFIALTDKTTSRKSSQQLRTISHTRIINLYFNLGKKYFVLKLLLFMPFMCDHLVPEFRTTFEIKENVEEILSSSESSGCKIYRNINDNIVFNGYENNSPNFIINTLGNIHTFFQLPEFVKFD